MATLRNETNKNFTIVNNHILLRKDVSLKAIGMYAKMVSLPDNWSFTEEGLCTICKDGRSGVRSALKELEDINMLFRFQAKDKGKFANNIYYISSEPMTTEQKKEILSRYNPKSAIVIEAEKPLSENQTSENHTQLNTNILNTKEYNKKEKKEKKETEFDILIKENFNDEEIKKTMYEFIKMRKAIKKPLTTHGLELIIKKLYKLSNNEDEQIEILNNSIMNNWQGIFELKKDEKNKMKNQRKYDNLDFLYDNMKG